MSKFKNPWAKGGEHYPEGVVDVSKVIDLNSTLSVTGDFGISVLNQSDYSIWIKPEDGVTPLEIKPHSTSNVSFDGVTCHGHPGEVFKVLTPLVALFVVAVNNQSVGFHSALSPMPSELNLARGGGWLKSAPDSGWDGIFKKAN